MVQLSRDPLHFGFPGVSGKQRFRELIIYVSKKSENDQYFGAIKLNKILYYSDFTAFERLGSPITGTVYFRLKNGPAPQALLPVRNELIQEGALRIEQVQMGPFRQDRTIALREAIISLFTTDQLQIVDTVINCLWSQNATEVSDASHDVRWRVLRNKDLVPYEFAFLDDTLTPDDRSRTEELAGRFRWARSGN